MVRRGTGKSHGLGQIFEFTRLSSNRAGLALENANRFRISSTKRLSSAFFGFAKLVEQRVKHLELPDQWFGYRRAFIVERRL